MNLLVLISNSISFKLLLMQLLLLFILLISSSEIKAARRTPSLAAQFDNHQSQADDSGSLSSGDEPPQLKESIAASQSLGAVQCEPISISLCSQMAYQSTRMPNFFHDSNQIEASDRAHQYEELVKSRCSIHVHAYVCELLTPVCLEDSREAMRRFEIYPCRSFCRRVKRDCEQELVKLNGRLFIQGSPSLLPGFACDLLPFESNGGNGTLRGPCHETPDLPSPPSSSAQHQPQLQQPDSSLAPSLLPKRQQSADNSNYRPYQPALETNIPPFITDITPLDPGAIRPASGADAAIESSLRPDRTPSAAISSVPAQLSTFAQTVLATLIRYSNLLSVITLLCLIAVLNSKRLRRLKNYLSLSPSSSAKSSSSSSGSQHHLHGQQQQQLHNGYNQRSLVGKRTGGAISPSSSSRSLMLIAGANNKQAPSHQLLPADHQVSEQPQKLLLGLNHKTLINVNASTLDRQQLNNRYILMQAAAARHQHEQRQHHQQQQQHAHHRLQNQFHNQHSDTQPFFGTLESQSSQSNQYDYIEVSSEQAATANRARQQQQQQQMYSNILLSSPSHQVLLFGNSNQQRQSQAPPTPVGSNSRGYAPYFATSQPPASVAPTTMSPYPSPGSLNEPIQSHHQSRSFQRRREELKPKPKM